MTASPVNLPRLASMFLMLALVLAACAPAATPAPVPTSMPPTAAPAATTLPPTATSVPPAASPISPTATPVAPAATTGPTAGPKISALDFRNAMRKLWEDHVTWTRLYIVSAAAGLPDQDLTAQRLLQNQVDIGNAIKPFYGDDAGNKLTALLKDHILDAADLIAAAKANDKAKVDAASAKWYANADDIATFLSTANPRAWPLADMKMGMKMHLDLTLQEAVDRLGGRYAADIADYDKVHEHILGMADLLSTGIISQFPDKFQ